MKILKIIGLLLLILVAGAGAFYAWASSASGKKLARKYSIHTVDFPVPFPLDSAEVRRLRLKPAAADSIALARAVERGRHLVQSRYACKECHGPVFGGGTMVDAAPVGTLLGSNLTSGNGSRTVNYTPADWDRIVRHGIRPDSTPAVMPSVDFRRMTDQELSDVIAYIRSYPAVDSTVPPIKLGPVLKVMLALGRTKPSADIIRHDEPHGVFPPDISATLEYGAHMAATCTGCHREDFSGGPIIGGPPDWPPAANITPAGIGSWSLEQFTALMREAKRPDGSEVREPMNGMAAFANNMSDQELDALFQYLKSLPPVETKN